LIKFVEARTADPVRVVVCWSFDRLSRSDTLSTFGVLDRLRQAGVRQVLTNSRTYDLFSQIDRTLLAVEQDFTSSGYVRKLSENTTRALFSRAKEGRWISRAPYAYVIGPDGHLTPADDARVSAVRWLFHAYATTGASLSELARMLTARGVPPPGKEWTRHMVWDILRNPVYTGLYRWNAEQTGRHFGVTGGDVAEVRGDGRRRRKKTAAEDQVIIPNAHPALVDANTFEVVAKKLARNQSRGTTPTRGHGGGWPLSGMVYCGGCGARMVGKTDRINDRGKIRVYQILRCANSMERGVGRCRTNRVRQQQVLREVAALVQENFADPDRLADMRAELECVAGETAMAQEADRQALRDRLAELDRRIDQGAENILLAPAGVRDRLTVKLQQWEADRATVARDLANAEAGVTARRSDAAEVGEALDALGRLEDVVTDAEPEAVRDVVASVVESVTLRFAHGRPRKNGARRAHLAGIELELLPAVRDYLFGTTPRTPGRSPARPGSRP
jgi:site-specific DNA recombinase